MSIIEPSSVDLVIYHANCSDGMGAAFAAWKLLGDRAEYVAANHGDTPPNVKGKTVAILDFSYNNATIKKMVKEADSLVIIDHHKSAMIELHDVSCTIFDMNHSGAMLAWKFFHPGKEAPQLIKHIEDRDLWKWELPYSKEFSAAFDMVPFSFEAFDAFLDDSAIDDAKERGAYILAYSKTVVSKIVKNATKRKLGGKDVLVVNSPHWMSEIGNSLGPKCDFALIWYWDHEKQQCRISLRAHHDDEDVSEIAKRYGGGGHRKAAGFSLPQGVSIESIFDPPDALVPPDEA
jgi:oligoribonuclease NrnB/cAMP/cGMP phosphodiesterase (DHH superfamily)